MPLAFKKIQEDDLKLVLEMSKTVARHDLAHPQKGDHMNKYKIGYLVGSFSSTSINRLLAKALDALGAA